MKVRVLFTVDIDPDKVAEVRKFMEVESNGELRSALTYEAAEYLVDYINDNIDGRPAKLTKE